MIVYKVTQRNGLSIGVVKLAYNLNEATVAPEFAGIERPLMAFDTLDNAVDFIDFLTYYEGNKFRIYECNAELSKASPRYVRSGTFHVDDYTVFWTDYWNNVPLLNYAVCTAPIGTVFCRIIVPKKEIK
jgi:hypothetical protein